MSQHRLSTCMLCEAACGLSVELDGERVVSVRGDREDPFSRGHVCPKAAAIDDVANDPDRVRTPLRRVGDGWEPVSWSDALDEAGERLAQVQARHGRGALGLYLGNPTVHSYTAMLGASLLSRALGSRARFSATSVDQLPQMLASLEMLGHSLLLPVPDVDRTSFFLVIGANPRASNGSLMTAPGIGARLDALAARGGTLVVVDPRRTETAARADVHLAVRPGGDAHLLLGVLHVIFAEGRARPGRLASFTDGLDRLAEIAARFPPERVAARAGIDAEAIRTLARAFAEAPRAVCYARFGACTQEHGGLVAWLVVALNVVTGNLDRPGGAMFTTPAADLVGMLAKTGDRGGFARYRSRVRGLPEFSGELPAAALAEEIDTPGKGQVRALVTFAGNPVLSTPNGARLDRALAGLDFMVSIDLYRNETTRHANLILPTSFGFEREHFDLAFNALAVRDVAKLAPALVPPPPGVRQDFDVLLDLARALRRHGGGRAGASTTLTLAGARALGPRRMLDAMLRLGPRRLSLAALARAPHGLDFGPLEARLPERLFTKDRRIELVPELFTRDLARLESTLDDARAPGALELIGRRLLRSNNSWMHNALRLVKGRSGCTLLIHPDDAAARGLATGDVAIVRSRVGEVRVPVAVSDDVVPGVVCLPHGFGHDRAGVVLGVAGAHAGASLNDLSDELRIDALSGNAAFSGTPVTVAKG
jgi:anaerobic selenocysteine-containing dehydrogenase